MLLWRRRRAKSPDSSASKKHIYMNVHIYLKYARRWRTAELYYQARLAVVFVVLDWQGPTVLEEDDPEADAGLAAELLQEYYHGAAWI